VNAFRIVGLFGLLALVGNTAFGQEFFLPDNGGFAEFVPVNPPGAYAPGSPYDLPPRTCPPWRPCGPANSFGANWLFYQGAYGADFRTACQNHDDCLMNPWNSRYGCDRAFYEAMAAECANSAHPGLCLWKAQKYYVSVRMLGGFVRAGAP
jgi:hypothetical protein